MVEDAIDQIRTILTADRITIIKLLKGKGIFRKMLEVNIRNINKSLRITLLALENCCFLFPRERLSQLRHSAQIGHLWVNAVYRDYREELYENQANLDRATYVFGHYRNFRYFSTPSI